MYRLNRAKNNLPLPINAQQLAQDNAGGELDETTPIAELFTALEERDLASILRILEQDGIDLSAQNIEGDTPLHLCIKERYMDGFHALMNCRPDEQVDAHDRRGDTPFITAQYVLSPQREIIIDALAKSKANINHPSQWKSTSTNLYEECSPLFDAVEGQSILGAKLLLENCADVNSLNNNGRPLLVRAADKDATVMVQLLIAAKADVNAPITQWNSDRIGFTPLAVAAQNAAFSENKQSCYVMATLLKAGAEIDHRSIEISSGYDDALNALLEGKIDIPGHNGITPREIIFDLVTTRKSSFAHEENPEFHIACEQFDAGNFNLAKIFAEAIKNSDLQKEFISSRMNIAVGKNDYWAIDAMRELGAMFYTQKEAGASKSNTDNAPETAPENILVKEFMTSNFLEIADGKYRITATPQGQEILDTDTNKVFFTAVMTGKSHTYLETVLLSKITFDHYPEELQENELLMTVEDDSTEASGTDDTADSMDLSALTFSVSPCLIGQMSENWGR